MENLNPNPNDAGEGVNWNSIWQAYDDQRLQNVSRPQQEEEGSDNWDLGLSQSVKLGQLQPVDLLRRDEPFYPNPFPNTTSARSNMIVVKLSGEVYSFDITVGFLDSVGHIKDEIVQYILKTYGQKISTDRIILRNDREVELRDHENLAAYDLKDFSILQLKLRDEEENFTV
ncbi:hypothetical protein M0R45_028021 [Rubus argutus]|uniref:Ubiquitin-like domain-containing protein n=1 Tax=Rubus argutus TaxID=59490 RepID=A0AAW1W699_RUBAR